MESTTKIVRYYSPTHFSSYHLVLNRQSPSSVASWPKTFASLLPSSRPYLDAVIDSGGGPIASQVGRIIKDGGVVSCYGQTSGKPIEINMAFILKNAELRGESSPSLVTFDRLSLTERDNSLGSTMGSRQEFFDAVKFIGEHKVQPVVDTVLTGLDEAEKGFELLKQGGQFGKVSSSRRFFYRKRSELIHSQCYRS